MQSITCITFERIVKEFVKRKRVGACLLASVLLVEALKKAGIGAKLIKGYWVGGSFYAEHYWVETDDGQQLDPAKKILLYVTGNVQYETTKLSVYEPIAPDYKRVDLETPTEIQDNLDLRANLSSSVFSRLNSACTIASLCDAI